MATENFERKRFSRAQSRETTRLKIDFFLLLAFNAELIAFIPLAIFSNSLAVGDGIAIASTLTGLAVNQVGRRHNKRIINKWHDPDAYDDHVSWM